MLYTKYTCNPDIYILLLYMYDHYIRIIPYTICFISYIYIHYVCIYIHKDPLLQREREGGAVREGHRGGQ